MSDRQGGGEMELVEDPETVLAQAPAGAEDIAAELAAPPRRKLPWVRLLLGAGLVASLAFAGGAWYQKNHGGSSTSAASGFAGRAALGSGGFPGLGGQNGQAGQGSGSTATTGTVKLVDGSTVYLTTADGSVVKVTTSGSTKVTVTRSGKPTDLTPGQAVTVQGTTDSSGNVKATSVTQGGGGAPSAGQ